MKESRVRHVAIVMDGNRRWAKREGVAVKEGHRKGGENIEKIARAAKECGVETLTLYMFSTENWLRSPLEVRDLMNLIESFLIEKRELLVDEGVRLKSIGRCDRLPKSLSAELARTKEVTAQGKNLNLVIALDYGGRDEIMRAIQKMSAALLKGQLRESDLTESQFASYLDTAPFGDPDIFIRTSGEQRISNFLLWQISYSELYMTDTLWPDFSPEEFRQVIANFHNRDRRKGE